MILPSGMRSSAVRFLTAADGSQRLCEAREEPSYLYLPLSIRLTVNPPRKGVWVGASLTAPGTDAAADGWPGRRPEFRDLGREVMCMGKSTELARLVESPTLQQHI